LVYFNVRSCLIDSVEKPIAICEIGLFYFMNANTLKRLQHFVGKVCSIVSTSMNRSFNETISREHFVVRIEEVNIDGIWGTHPYNDMISFFAMPHIISVHEEMELDPNNPEHAAMIAEYEKQTGAKVKTDLMRPEVKPPEKKKTGELLPVLDESPVFDVDQSLDTGDATFVDIESLERLAEKTKRTFDAYDLLGKHK